MREAHRLCPRLVQRAPGREPHQVRDESAKDPIWCVFNARSGMNAPSQGAIAGAKLGMEGAKVS